MDITAFAEAREWNRYHTPRNLVLALLGEVGELAELVQWDGDDDMDNDKMCAAGAIKHYTLPELDKLSQELADVAIYT